MAEGTPDRSPRAGPAPSGGAVRLHAWLSGEVQGVGMRFTVVRAAGRRRLTGWVRNLDDGRVELVAEGPRGDLEDLLASLQEDMAGYIRRADPEWGRATGEWDGFRIEY